MCQWWSGPKMILKRNFIYFYLKRNSSYVNAHVFHSWIKYEGFTQTIKSQLCISIEPSAKRAGWINFNKVLSIISKYCRLHQASKCQAPQIRNRTSSNLLQLPLESNQCNAGKWVTCDCGKADIWPSIIDPCNRNQRLIILHRQWFVGKGYLDSKL